MESNNPSYFRITPQDLKQYVTFTNKLFKGVKWKSNVQSANQKKNGLEVIASTISDNITTQEISLANHSFTFSDDDFLLPESINTALNVVLDGFKIGIHISKLYSKASNLDVMQKEKSMSSERQTEYRKKLNMACAIQSFVTAYYIVFNLSQYKSEITESIQMQDITIPEMDYKSTVSNRNCLMFYFATYIKNSGLVKSEYEFLKMTVKYFQAVMDDVKLKENAFDYSDIFTSQNYKLEGSEFSVSGFDVKVPGTTSVVEFNKVHWGEIVGNTESKHKALKSVLGVLCYCIDEQKNPMFDLGGFASSTLTYGPPGTGKSMEIAAIATELEYRCKDLGIPFFFSPMPDNIVDTYQGGSARNMLSWMTPLQDPSRITFAPIDDAENNLQNRLSDGVSAGVLEIVAVYLRLTEGAYAINHGNMLIKKYTNLPEMIDPAVLSRVQLKAFMGGAETLEDFLDQDKLGLLNHFEKIMPGFVDIEMPKDYIYMSDQNVKSHIQKAYEAKALAKTDRVAEIVESIKAKYPITSPEFFASIDVSIKAVYPGYTSRDKRNIQSAVKQRTMDFEFPQLWLDDPSKFFAQEIDYKQRKGMIIEVAREHMQGKNFSQIYLEEIVSYLDNMATIADRDFDRKVEQYVNQAKIITAGQKILKN